MDNYEACQSEYWDELEERSEEMARYRKEYREDGG